MPSCIQLANRATAYHTIPYRTVPHRTMAWRSMTWHSMTYHWQTHQLNTRLTLSESECLLRVGGRRPLAPRTAKYPGALSLPSSPFLLLLFFGGERNPQKSLGFLRGKALGP